MSKIIIAGDYVPQNRIAEKVINRDFSFFDDIKDRISHADYAILNLEAPIVQNKISKIPKYGPHLYADKKTVDSLVYAGFDMVTLANNHILDYGEAGLNTTIEYLTKSNIEWIGVGKNIDDAYTIKYVKLGNDCIAVINACENEFSIATETSAGAAPIDVIRIYNKIQEAKKEATCIIVIIHGGHELFQLPSIDMVKMYRFFIDIGASVVVNHHQHCYSGYEIYKDHPIYYGIGNLCFDWKKPEGDIWNYGYMVEVNTDKLQEISIIPYRQGGENEDIKLLPVDAFSPVIEKINANISDSAKLKAEIDAYYEKCIRNCEGGFQPYNNRYLSALFRRGYLPSVLSRKVKIRMSNLILCESHRAKLAFWLKSIR